MKRETRANLIFLIAICVISLPGAVILFKKKMDAKAPPMFMPDYVKRKLPYMAPQLTPDSEVMRVVPEETGRWVEQVQQEHGSVRVLRRGRMPVISDDRVIQVLDARDGIVQMLIWDRDYEIEKIEVEAEEGPAAWEVDKVARITVPEDVRKELMYAGFARAPHEVKWVEAHASKGSGLRPGAIVLTYRRGAEKGVSRVNLFTNGGAGGN